MPENEPLHSLFHGTPVNRFLGLRLARASGGEAELSMPVREEYAQEGGLVQGGIVGALADTAAAYALAPTLASGETMRGIELRVSFLRPARREGGELVARSRVLQRGRRLGRVEVEISQDGRHVAQAQVAFLFTRQEEPEPRPVAP